jgi:hypothetical protein
LFSHSTQYLASGTNSNRAKGIGFKHFSHSQYFFFWINSKAVLNFPVFFAFLLSELQLSMPYLLSHIRINGSVIEALSGSVNGSSAFSSSMLTKPN